jgi:hypothetical protein
MGQNARAAATPQRAGPAATASAAALDSGAGGEHIFMGSDEPVAQAAVRTVSGRTLLVNRLRRAALELTLYTEGLLEVREQRGGRAREPIRLDLVYLDPVPAISRFVARRTLLVAVALTAGALAAGAAARVDALRAAAWPIAAAAAIGALLTLLLALHRSQEKTTFMTIHGRAPVLALTAHFGSIRRFRAFVPILSRAIEDAAERIGDDTAAFLRAEMREHYRLRGEGVLTQDTCAASTGRILAQFDIQL